ncbi:LolA-like outer membrane lipoprotein chaperone [Campylobacter sp.]|uniref:LolA-like outer membrane lipoprotein chaperone n=1 Tax=Campylobacter sp. TaxID=205 RepID=UPI0026DC0191|nr:LolA-like outer membrane lipoprotein chaperone [Campylobacter sp.]MDO4674524.1 LolA-like outer membrane lipoprotein chaperone [Campylobacter sp.]
MKILIFLGLFWGPIFALDLNFKNLSADFVQGVHSQQGKIEYKGHFVLQNNRALWSYEEPAKKEIYINDDEIVIVEHDLEQVLISRIDSIPNLSEIFKKAKRLGAAKFEAKYQNINYTIELENDAIKKISYKDELENFVSITLFKLQKDGPIDPKIFTPKYPQNYDIVR